jgi:pyridinium-3,5-bisthiocarboxylic acid mononucleotide nickel chelatase
VQARDFVEIETRYGKVRVKTTPEGGYAPEYEDCRRLAAEHHVPLKQVIAEANNSYRNQSR